MTNYEIATMLSFVTACFTCASSWAKIPSRSYYYQVAQCLVYSAAAWFYGIYACTVMMLINALRNFLVASGRYTMKYCVVFSILALVLGLWSNTSGITGLLTVAATIQYSICSYFLKKKIPVKINILINLMIWLSYDILVKDFFSGVMDIIGATLAGITIFRIIRSEETESKV